MFFRSPAARPAAVRWSIVRNGERRELVAVNAGERRLRIARLSLQDTAGEMLNLGDGLSGYALGGGERRWRLPPGRSSSSAPITVRFVSENGPESANVSLLATAGS